MISETPDVADKVAQKFLQAEIDLDALLEKSVRPILRKFLKDVISIKTTEEIAVFDAESVRGDLFKDIINTNAQSIAKTLSLDVQSMLGSRTIRGKLAALFEEIWSTES